MYNKYNHSSNKDLYRNNLFIGSGFKEDLLKTVGDSVLKEVKNKSEEITKSGLKRFNEILISRKNKKYGSGLKVYKN